MEGTKNPGLALFHSRLLSFGKPSNNSTFLHPCSPTAAVCNDLLPCEHRKQKEEVKEMRKLLVGIADVFEGDSEDIVSMTSLVLGEGRIVDIRENKQRHLGESAIAASLVQSSRENRMGRSSLPIARAAGGGKSMKTVGDSCQL